MQRKFMKVSALALIGLAYFAGGIVLKDGGTSSSGSLLVPEAQARIGRPLTPLSYAGVARRTTRRAIRRGALVRSIPPGCAYGTYHGYSLYYCGGVYYQRSGNGYVIVYF